MQTRPAYSGAQGWRWCAYCQGGRDSSELAHQGHMGNVVFPPSGLSPGLLLMILGRMSTENFASSCLALTAPHEHERG